MLLELANVTLQNFSTTVFENLSFVISPGQHWAVIGDSNSGTGALLEAIGGKYHIVHGTRTYGIDHPVISKVASAYHYRNLSTTTEFFYQQRFNMSGEEDADTVHQFLTDVEQRNRKGQWTTDRVIQRLRLRSLSDKQLILLSNGETKRVMIAAALLRNPDILLLDHPLMGLDVQARSDFNELISEIVSTGIHLVIATPANEIPDAITHVTVLGNHRIVDAVPRRLFDASKYMLRDKPEIDHAELNSLLTKVHEKYDVIIGMKDVSVSYGGKSILSNLTWTVRQGERWALTGHNGAGKSTLLSLINGDNPQAYANNITLFDQRKGRGESIWNIKKRIGYISPELYRYFPVGHLCEDVIESGFYDTLGLFKRSDAQNLAIVRRWMDLLGIQSSFGKQFTNIPLSHQRLCLLARALIKSPALLILDEPCEGLDSNQQNSFVAIVDDICRMTDVTMVYVSHYKDQFPSAIEKEMKLVNGSAETVA